jgi:phage gp36-like protein
MTYCTYEDIELRIGTQDLAALADYDDDGTADEPVVERAVRSASSLIDSYLGVRFAVPVALPEGTCPEALTTRAVNLAIYFLRLGRDSVTEDARVQYEDDMAWLKEVVAGSVSLGVEPSPAEGSGAPGARYESQPRLFGRAEPL